MEELIVAILLGICDIFAEALFEILGQSIVVLLSRALDRLFGSPRVLNSALTAIEYAVFGLMAGWVSVVLVPHRIVRPSSVHGISLVVSPVIAGLVMAFVGSALRRKGKPTAQIESFSFGYVFAFGMALIRFLFVK